MFELPTSFQRELGDRRKYHAQYGTFAVDKEHSILRFRFFLAQSCKALSEVRTKAEALTLNKRVVERVEAAALILALLVNARNMFWLNERVDKKSDSKYQGTSHFSGGLCHVTLPYHNWNFMTK